MALVISDTNGISLTRCFFIIFRMEEKLGICAKRSLGSKQEGRKSGNFGSLRAFFSVTPDKKIKLISNSPGKFKLIEYSEFEATYKVIEIPSFTLSQYRMQRYKAELKGAKVLGESLRDYRFKIKAKESEQIITIKQMGRSSAVKQIIKEFKHLNELHEWYDGDWLLIKRGK